MNKGLEKAIEIFGNQNRLAIALGVTRNSVNFWMNDKAKISYGNVIKLVELTRWKVKPHDLRPDIYPRGTTWKSGNVTRSRG